MLTTFSSQPRNMPDLATRLSIAWETIDYAVTLVGPENRIEYANLACAELYRYSTDELIGRSVDEIVSWDADDLDYNSRPAAAGRWSVEGVGVKKFGGRFAVHLTATEIEGVDGSKLGAAIVHEDITQEITSRRQLWASAEALRKEADNSAAIVKIGWMVNASLDVGSAFDQVAAELRRLVPFDGVEIWEIDGDQAVATARYVWGAVVPGLGVGAEAPVSDQAFDFLVRSRSVVATDMDDVPRPDWRAMTEAEAAGLRSMIGVPLISSDSVVGLLFLRSRAAGAFSAHDLAAVRRVGMQIAGAIANSQLFNKVRQQAEQREVLAKIGRIVTSSPKIGNVYEPLDVEVRRLFHFDGFSICMLDRETGEPACSYVSGNGAVDRNPCTAALVKAITEEVISRRAAVNVHLDDEGTLPGRHEDLALDLEGAPRSYLSAPLTAMNEVIGIVHFRSSRSNAYGRREKDLAERVADQISGAIANGHLYAEHVLTEEALRESEERYRMLVENANDAIIVIQDGRIVYRNAAWERLLGHDEPSESTEFVEHIVPSDRDRILEYHRDLVRGAGTLEAYEMRLVTHDDVELTLEAKPRVVTYRDRPSVMVVMRDISERIRLQEQLLQAQKMEAIGQLAGGVAHDFNNLLSVIMGFSQLAERARLTAANDLPGHLAEIRKASQRGASLTNQLLAFSRRQVAERRIVDVNQMVLGLERMLRRLIEESIRLVITECPDGGKVFVDPGQFEQVVINLVVNARDAMPDGGTVTVQLDRVAAGTAQPSALPGDDGRDYIVMTVRDDGVGIPDTVKPRIFEPFFTTKDVGFGTGLGLSTCYGIVKQAGGHITVDSEVGRGAVFRVYLPTTAETHVPASDSAPTPSPRGVEKVMLVEDEPAVRDMLVAVLNGDGYSVLDASNGIEALELARERADESVDLLITDVVMPKMGGKKLAMEMKKLNPQMKVLYISAYPNAYTHQVGAGRLDASFIQKPFTIEEFARKLIETI